MLFGIEFVILVVVRLLSYVLFSEKYFVYYFLLFNKMPPDHFS
jgi:hypothetical protein